jgi:hypothetical protein
LRISGSKALGVNRLSNERTNQAWSVDLVLLSFVNQVVRLALEKREFRFPFGGMLSALRRSIERFLCEHRRALGTGQPLFWRTGWDVRV